MYTQSQSRTSNIPDGERLAVDESARHHRSQGDAQEGSQAGARPRNSNRTLGGYTLSKTLAIKILPHVPISQYPTNNDATTQKANKDASKEIQTLREASLSMLLHHPYICGMREMINPSTSLLHGFRICEWWTDARLYHQPWMTARTRR